MQKWQFGSWTGIWTIHPVMEASSVFRWRKAGRCKVGVGQSCYRFLIPSIISRSNTARTGDVPSGLEEVKQLLKRAG